MLIHQKASVAIKKFSRSYVDGAAYPYYKLMALNESGDYRLIFCCSASEYLVLNGKVKRHQAVNLLRRHMETARYPAFEL